ncbi:MAG: hypothetical protein AB7U20_15700 [Planctomycetaceae bacterium]
MTKVHGIIHGRTIELHSETDLPEGQEVNVIVQPIDKQNLPPGEGLRLSTGACADEEDAWDEFDKWYREERERDRPPIEDDE